VIIDCHGHYTTAPSALKAFRRGQIDAFKAGGSAPADPQFSDDEIRDSLEGAQLKLMRERGHDLTIFSPIAGAMEHHVGDEAVSQHWSRVSNDLIHRVARLYPRNFAAVCQLPQSPGASPAGCIEELERCVAELGFIGCNLNPDPSGGYWNDPPITDPWWFPLYEKLSELDVPAMIHVSNACNPNFSNHVGSHYINGDTTAFVQLMESDLFERYPNLKLIIPHGGGAVPYHWGRYRGIAQDRGWKPLPELMENLFFDTCVYHQRGVSLLTDVVPADNILFGSEMVGAVRGIDPETGRHYDDTRPFVEAAPGLSDDDKTKIFSGNARRLFKRLDASLNAMGIN
jgi:4-oxalmesaconate hydratase